MAIFADAAADLAAGLRMRRLWIALATEDIGDQHRRTTLGPLWLLLNYLAFAGTFIFIFHAANVSTHYAAYVATGLLVWFYMMDVISSSVTLFGREESFIKGTRLPISVYVFRMALQSVMRAGYALIGCAAILVLTGTALSPAWLWAVAGALVILLTAPAVIIVCAFLGLFFPDSQYIVSNLMRIGMFVTPVFWSGADSAGLRAAFYHYNPFTYFLEIVRVPIVAGAVPFRALVFCIGVGVVVWLVALLLLGRFRRQVALVL